ncbi:MAG TPA: ATP-binding protein, partial [Solirubrobacteraceae bacterium]|nr:ATP-binding protein [Solirubrobacteraceae bacterium]
RPVTVRVVTGGGEVRVQITDLGGAPAERPREMPDLEAKLAGEQRPRGWGLFLIENMVDELRETSDEGRHTLELAVRLEGGDDGDE